MLADLSRLVRTLDACHLSNCEAAYKSSLFDC
jgi:hypothetical protein